MAGSTRRYTDYDSTAVDVSTGVDGLNLGSVTFGMAFGYSTGAAAASTGRADDADLSTWLFGATLHVPVNASGRGINMRAEETFSFASTHGEITRNVDSDLVGIDETSKNGFSASGLQGEARFDVVGMNGNTWLVHPLVLVGGNSTRFGDIRESDHGPSALSIEGEAFKRLYVGAGLELHQKWGENNWVMLRGTGLSYFGETQNSFDSHFRGATPGTTTFETLGAPVSSVMLFEGGMGYTFSGIDLGLEGFAEMGDRTSLGGGVHVSTKF